MFKKYHAGGDGNEHCNSKWPKAIYTHPNDNIEEKYGLLTRAYSIFSGAR